MWLPVRPFGNQFLEVVSPLPGSTGSAGERFLQRRGDGGYMVICQTDDFSAMRQRVDDMDVRLVHSFEVPDDITGRGATRGWVLSI